MAPQARGLPSSPLEFLQVVWRRKWVVLIPLVLIAGFSVFLARALPNVYRASTVILVAKPKVPETYVRHTVTTRIEDRLTTINEQLLSRSWLERVIMKLDLFPAEQGVVPMERLVARLRRDIEVRVHGRGRNRDSFSITVRGRDPKVVRDVTNELAALFIEENSKVREEQATGTSEFLESQLAALKQTLSEQERQVRAFKERYMGALPQQQEANLRALDRLQLQSRELADQLRAAEDRRLVLQRQLAEVPPFTAVPSTAPARPAVTSGSGTPPPTPRDPLAVQLEHARTSLAQLRARYTDLHPDVMRARRQLEEIEALAARRSAMAAQAAPTPAPAHSPEPTAPEGSEASVAEVRRTPNPMYETLVRQLALVDREIQHLRQKQGEVTSEIRTLQQRVENVPRLEQQLLELTRDYNNTRAAYEALLAKKLEAQLAANLERYQKSEQFVVLDPAVLPQTPYRPNRRLIIVVGLVIGLGAGFLGAAGAEMLDRSIGRPEQLRAALPQVPLVGTVPIIRTRRQIWRRRLIGTAATLAGLLAAAAVVVAAERYKETIVNLSVFEFLLR